MKAKNNHDTNAIIHYQFRAWLGRQRTRKDPVGDFARDFLDDECAKKITTLSGIDYHLKHEHGAEDEVLQSRDRAWREFIQTNGDGGEH